MSRTLRPGPASLLGLTWLARVGPCSLEPWRLAMGWSAAAARSHARRLEDQGWLARYPMTRGAGSLFVATRIGVRVVGLPLRAAGAPAPTWWAHHCACAWTAAYLHLGDRRFLGDRELLEDRSWSGSITWTDGKGRHTARHRPDLVGYIPGGPAVSIEVELAQKSLARLRAIITLHAQWRARGHSAGVLYVCGDQDGIDRVTRVAESIGSSGMAARLLSSLREQVLERGETRRSARVEQRSSDGDPSLVARGGQ